MRVPPFLLDHWLAKYQFATPSIRYDLASSTGPKWTVGEVLALEGADAGSRLEELSIAYSPATGSAELRNRIGALHGVDPSRVVVTVGASEALLVMLCAVAEPGANVVLPSPVFPAIPVIARLWGLEVKAYELSRQNGFEQNPEEILRAVDARTRLVFVNTPHNPTGAVMSRESMARLAEELASRGIPVVVDEVYHPLYFGTQVPTAAEHAGVTVLSDLSKALSLSGLRVGWLIEPDPARLTQLTELRSYFTISNSCVTEALAAAALGHVPRILSRLEAVAKANLALLDEFMRRHADQLDWVRPVGGTTAFPWLRNGRNSRPLCEALAARGVLVAPGDCFERPEHIRIGFAAQATGFADALAIASEVVSTWKQ